MAFTVNDFQDLLRLLDEHPEWRDELRRRLLPQELLELPAIVRQLADQLVALTARLDQLTARVDQLTAQVEQLTVRLDQLTARVDQLTARVDQLTAQVEQLTVRLDQLTARVDQLTARVDQLTAQVEQLTVRLDQLTARVDQLTARVDQLAIAQERTERELRRVAGHLGRLDGEMFQMKFAERSPAYLSRFARRLRRIDSARLADMLDDAADEGRITSAERDDVLLADVVLSGRRREDDAEAYYVVEVSAGVRPDDVARAKRRADVMAKLGRPATPIVVGERISSQAATLADRSGVTQFVEPSIWPGAGLDLD
jgi:methyl-accepting chemotaxis protein